MPASASLLAAWGSLLGLCGGNGGCPAQAGLQESSVPGMAPPPLPLRAPPAPSPPRPAQWRGREGGREALPGWPPPPPSAQSPWRVTPGRRQARLGLYLRGGGQQGTNTKKAEEVPLRLLLLPPSSLAVKMQHEQMANINTTMEESGAGPQHPSPAPYRTGSQAAVAQLSLSHGSVWLWMVGGMRAGEGQRAPGWLVWEPEFCFKHRILVEIVRACGKFPLMMRGFYFEGELFVEAFMGAPQPLPGWWDTPNVPFPKHRHHQRHAVTAASRHQVLPSLERVAFVPAGSSDRNTLPAPRLVMFMRCSRPSQRNITTSGKPPDSPGNFPLGSATPLLIALLTQHLRESPCFQPFPPN